VANAAQEPSIVLERVEASQQRSFGYNAARREFGDLMEMGVIDPAKVVRLALQNAGSIASLILTIDCVIAEVPQKSAERAAGFGAGREME
jgi:chaperonin GroEL